MNTLHKFPSIEQFRSSVQFVTHKSRYIGIDENGDPIYDGSITLPKLKFRGTVKMHGTNAGMIFKKENNWIPYFQSRESIISPEKDNYGFAGVMSKIDLSLLLKRVLVNYPNSEDVRVYGEWCGKGIQDGVAVSKIEKFFVVFAIKVDDVWIGDDTLKGVKLVAQRIFNVLDFPHYEIEIDFENPKNTADSITEMVLAVEKECPVGKLLGAEGVGEGIVWMCKEEGWNTERIWFKTKGDKHKSSNTKELVPVDIEKIQNVLEFVELVATESRLKQGLDYLTSQNLENTKSNFGKYISWFIGDVLKEETDTLEANGLSKKDVNGPISEVVRNWFFNQCK